jgi:predicted nucleic acid-binding protein
MNQIVIDSGAILAAVDNSDKFHDPAEKYLRKQSDAVLFLVPELIFAETMTLVKARLGAATAVDIGRRLYQSPRFLVVNQTDEDRNLTWEIFQQYADKEWSFADCAILSIARRMNVNFVFSFDRHIVQMAEVERVP